MCQKSNVRVHKGPSISLLTVPQVFMILHMHPIDVFCTFSCNNRPPDQWKYWLKGVRDILRLKKIVPLSILRFFHIFIFLEYSVSAWK
jgi:hypothetical protein